MNIVVSLRKIWGKELFYPESDDARLFTKMIGRPTITKKQLKVCQEAGWKVTLIQDQLDLEDYLRFIND